MQAGYASVKMFTTDITPQRMAHMVPFGDIWEVIKAVAKAGGLTCIHAEDNDLVMHMYEKLLREDRMGFENLAAAHTTLSEDLAFNRVIRLAESVEGAAMYMVHTSARTGVNAMAAARARGFPVYGETLHQYLLYNSEDYKRPGGQIYHTYPSLKFPEDQAALWQAMRHGAIQCVATDEVCCPLEVKLKGSRIDDTMGGNSGVEPRVSLMYTQMVQRTRLQPGGVRCLGIQQRRQDHGPLSAQGCARGGLGCRHRAAGSKARRNDPQGESARNRLYAVGGLGCGGMAKHDHSARQGYGRER